MSVFKASQSFSMPQSSCQDRLKVIKSGSVAELKQILVDLKMFSWKRCRHSLWVTLQK